MVIHFPCAAACMQHNFFLCICLFDLTAKNTKEAKRYCKDSINSFSFHKIILLCT